MRLVGLRDDRRSVPKNPSCYETYRVSPYRVLPNSWYASISVIIFSTGVSAWIL